MKAKNDIKIKIQYQSQLLPKLNIKNCREQMKKNQSQKILQKQKKQTGILQLQKNKRLQDILYNANTKSKQSLIQRQDILFKKVFLQTIKDEKKNKIKNNNNMENISIYDESIQKIKAINKKKENYKIYNIIIQKNKKQNKLIKKQSIIQQQSYQKIDKKKNDTPQIHDNIDIYKQNKYFNKQINLEIPNLLSCEKNQVDILGINDNSITKKILENYIKNKQILNVNYLQEQKEHEFQLIFYQALIQENKHNYSLAIKYYKKFLKYCIFKNKELLTQYCYNKLGINYYNLKKFEVSIQFHQQCIKYQITEKQIISKYNIGLALRQLNKIQQAQQMFQICNDFSIQQNVVQKGLKIENNFIDTISNMQNIAKTI